VQLSFILSRTLCQGRVVFVFMVLSCEHCNCPGSFLVLPWPALPLEGSVQEVVFNLDFQFCTFSILFSLFIPDWIVVICSTGDAVLNRVQGYV